MTGTVRLCGGVSEIAAEDWDVCAGRDNPFMHHAFLAALEKSHSVGKGTGWMPAPFVLEAEGHIQAILPAYLKGHSQGEYVFDHAWADAWERSGGRYYPKLQIAAPFTPAPGPRILAKESADVQRLLKAVMDWVAGQGLSSAHATFVDTQQLEWFRDAGWLIREGVQFHWENEGYRDFEEFLEALSSRKRKNIRKERAQAQAAVEIVALQGHDIKQVHWDAFWIFYQDTGARKWGTPYLTRAFFDEIGATMADDLLLFLALHDGQPVAGALNFIGADTLYGRYWGCTRDVPCLHFELCYYQAIEHAIARGLKRVEAGAQGEHKLARGYRAVPTWSAHYIPHQGFQAAVGDFLEREREAMAAQREFLNEMAPFKKG